MRICEEARSVTKQDGYFAVETNCVEIRICFVTDEIIRIRAGFDGDFSEESYSLALTAWADRLDDFMKNYRKRIEPADACLADGAQEAVITGKRLKVVVEKKPFRICIYDEEGTMLHADITNLAYLEDSNRRRIHTSEIDPEDCFYGFGERGGKLNKAQQYMALSPRDSFRFDPIETDCLYKHIPFYIKLSRSSKKAVGYFYHNTYECDFDMGRQRSNYWKRHSRYRTDGGDIDLFFISGPTIRNVVERYTDLTGKAVLLPKFALGYMGSSMYYPELSRDCDDAVINFIDTVHEEKIPMDGFQLSSGYCNIPTKEGLKRCVFTWNKKRFKDPKQFFAEMNRRGAPVVPNVKPGVLTVHPLFDEMKEKGMFVRRNSDGEPGIGTWWGGPGAFVDFTRESARQNWTRLLKENVLEYGTSCIWNDNCEYDSIVDKDFYCDFDGKGGTVGQLKSVMSNLMCHISDEAIREVYENRRPYIICRSGHAGIQRYAQTWTGDNTTSWDTLKYNLATILGMGLCGGSNHACELGGFGGPSPEAELFVRWVQSGVFMPRFSIHSVNSDNTVTEPWMYGKYKDTIRHAIEFRYRLSPYLYSLMARASETGLPMMEAMCSAFQNDVKCYEESFDFMLGDSLLVANVLDKGAVTRSVYLPEGEHFYDFETREAFDGGQTVEVPVDMESMPLFVRSGAIIPMSARNLYNLQNEPVTSLHVLLAPDKDSEFTLYEDDGITFDYQNGQYLKTSISVHAGEQTHIAFSNEGSYQTAVEEILLDVIHREKCPYWVMLDQEELPHFLHRKKFEACTAGWYYSQSKKSVQIRYPNPAKDHCVTISFEEFDMLGM